MPNYMRSKGGKRGHLRGKKFPKRTQTVLTFRSSQSYLPQKFVTCHVYQNDTSVTSVTPVDFQFALINIGRPEPDGAFERVNGFQEMNLFYKQWIVNYSSLTLIIQNTDDGFPLNTATVPRSDFQSMTDMSEMAQNPYGRFKMCTQSSGSRAMVVYKYGCNPNSLLGRKTITGDPGLYSGVNTTGPSGPMAYNLHMENAAFPELDVNCVFTFRIKYYVTWWDRKISFQGEIEALSKMPEQMAQVTGAHANIMQMKSTLALTGGITIKNGKEEMDDEEPRPLDQFIGPINPKRVPGTIDPKKLAYIMKMKAHRQQLLPNVTDVKLRKALR